MKGDLNKMARRIQKGIYRRGDPQAGMTLIEVVLAIAVAAFVLTAATSFVVSVSSIWSPRAERHFFEDHVDGVVYFLQRSFDSAGFAIRAEEGSATNSNSNSTRNVSNSKNSSNAPPTIKAQQARPKVTKGTDKETTGVSLIGSTKEPIKWQRPPGYDNFDDPLLGFELNELPVLFNSPENLPALGGAQVYLHFDKENGLRMLWYPLLQEEVEAVEDMRSTMISPWLHAFEYIYWDEDFEEWETLAEPKEGEGDDQWLLPRYLKLIFIYNDVQKARTIAIPVPMKSAFLF
jgi:prepilin-type N-terminal cleavage/methylation domain-containing protein